jgi:hypothetical protein
MDNDLMARRLRPPSVPPRPANGNSQRAAANKALPDTTDPRADIPWDRPADEPWPPTEEHAQMSQSWPPAPPAPQQPRTKTQPRTQVKPAETQAAVEPGAFVAAAPQTPVAQPSPESLTAEEYWDSFGDWDPIGSGVAETEAEPVAEAVAEETEAVVEVADVADVAEVVEVADVAEPAIAEPKPEPEVEAVADVEPLAAVADEAESERPSPEMASTWDGIGHDWDEPVPAMPGWDVPAPPVEPEPEPQPEPEMVAEPATEPETVAEPATETVVEPEVVADAVVEPTADVVAEPDVTDAQVESEIPWDRPEPWTAEEDAVDDRPPEMLDSYEEMVPFVSAVVAERTAGTVEQETEAVVEPEAEADEAEDEVELESAAEAVAEPVAESAASVELEAESEAFEAPAMAAEGDIDAQSDAEVESAWTEPDEDVEPVSGAAAIWAESEPSTGEAEDEPEAAAAPAEPVTEAQVEAESDAVDPYDATAPVLGDVFQPAYSPWADWSDDDDAATNIDVVDYAATPDAVAPAGYGDVSLGPTPPDDLFESPETDGVEVEAEAQPVADATADTEADASEDAPAAEADSEAERNVQTVTTEIEAPAAAGGQPVVLRIELAIVDGALQVRPVDNAKHVGPWVTASGQHADEEEDFTPRDPDFDPRNQLGAAEVPEETPGPAPWVSDESGVTAQDSVDLPWALPPLKPLTPAPAPQPPAPASGESDWTRAGDASAWPSEPVPEAMPISPSASAAAPAVSAPMPATDVSQVTESSDLWFLASEPQALAPTGPETPKSEPSTLLTGGLTIAMAVVVIVLVLVFIQLMTSLLR